MASLCDKKVHEKFYRSAEFSGGREEEVVAFLAARLSAFAAPQRTSVNDTCSFIDYGEMPAH